MMPGNNGFSEYRAFGEWHDFNQTSRTFYNLIRLRRTRFKFPAPWGDYNFPNDIPLLAAGCLIEKINDFLLIDIRITTNYCNRHCSELYCLLTDNLNKLYADRGKKSRYEMH